MPQYIPHSIVPSPSSWRALHSCPQPDGHIGLSNRVLLEFRKVIAVVVGGSGVNGLDPKPQVR